MQTLEQVKDVAKMVYNELGDGRNENVYEQAMAVEFRLRGIPYEMEVYTEVFYKGHRVGTTALDFIVDDSLIVELKSVGNIQKTHIAQTQAYMREKDILNGVVINFPYPMKSVQFEEIDLTNESDNS